MILRNYYFTFSQEGQLFNGGWVRITCENEMEARQMFIHVFGDEALNDQGLLRCADVYNEKTFMESGMLEAGNFGSKAHVCIEKRA